MPPQKCEFRLGERTPRFVLPLDERARFSLQENLGPGLLLLGFIRGTWCPFCRQFMKQLLAEYQEFHSRNCEVVLIASQSLPPILRFVRQEKLPFKILSDADRRVTREYGIFQPLGLMGINGARPAVFLLDEEGRLLYQYIGSAARRPPLREVLDHLQSRTRKKSWDGIKA